MNKCEKSTDEEIIEHGRGNENVWDSVHKLNPNSKYFEQKFEPKDIEKIEKICGEQWTSEWIERTKHRPKSQKRTDRELLEKVGSWQNINGRTSIPNETEIKRLLSNGATCDFVVHWNNNAAGYLWNAIDFAICLRNEKISQLLIKKCPNYKKETNGYRQSLLGDLFSANMFSAGIELIKTKEPAHPLYDLINHLKDANDKDLIRARRRTRHVTNSSVTTGMILHDSKFRNLTEEIFKFYNPATQVKFTFQMLADKNEFHREGVKEILELLKNYFLNNSNYGPKIIQSALGSTYEIDGPICSRFERNGKKVWVAQEIRNLKLEGLVEFKKDQSGKI